jgi:preprotein translocase subunit SecA
VFNILRIVDSESYNNITLELVTGHGKTIISTMLAVVMALRNHKVTIVTSTAFLEH